MDRIVRAFREHPATVGESYLEHMRSALGFSAAMVGAAVCCTVHAFLPFLFQKTGSTTIEGLHRRMVRQRGSKPAPAPAKDTRDSRAAA